MAPNNPLPIHGNEKTMNMNPLILTNIQSSPYFKVNLYELKTYHEVIDEIYYKVDHLEPWEKGSRKTAGQTGMCGGVRGVGAGGIVSSAYCLLYKLFTLRLTRKQLNGLLTHTDSPYIRGLGFMYIRYTQPPADFWEWYSPYLEDEEELDVKAGGGHQITIGELVRQWLHKLEWYSTLFPRIPVPVQKSIQQNLKEFDDGRAPAVQEVEAEPYENKREQEHEEEPHYGEAERMSRMRDSRERDGKKRSRERDDNRPRERDFRQRERDDIRSRERDDTRRREREDIRSRERDDGRSRDRGRHESFDVSLEIEREKARQRREREKDRPRERDRDQYRDMDRERDRRDRDRIKDYAHERDYDRNERERDRDKERGRDRERDREKRDRDRLNEKYDDRHNEYKSKREVDRERPSYNRSRSRERDIRRSPDDEHRGSSSKEKKIRASEWSDESKEHRSKDRHKHKHKHKSKTKEKESSKHKRDKYTDDYRNGDRYEIGV